jgi:5-methylcytosine-specific restriction endonuclease McrA
MLCRDCKKNFIPNPHWHHKWGLCNDCKIINIRKIKAKYKKTNKGIKTNNRWIKSNKRWLNEKKYRSKPKARHLAVLRATKHLEKCIKCQQAKKIRDKNYSKSKLGRKNNNKATKKYRKTEKGKWQLKTYKYRLRNNKSGKIDKKLWEAKLLELNGECQMCKTKEKITIDHIIPLSKGGKNNIDNLQPLCISCNCSKNNKI